MIFESYFHTGNAFSIIFDQNPYYSGEVHYTFRREAPSEKYSLSTGSQICNFLLKNTWRSLAFGVAISYIFLFFVGVSRVQYYIYGKSINAAAYLRSDIDLKWR